MAQKEVGPGRRKKKVQKTEMGTEQKKVGNKGQKRARNVSVSLCPVAGKCGGCQWINRSYQEQLEAKETELRRLMEPYCRPERMIGMDQRSEERRVGKECT